MASKQPDNVQITLNDCCQSTKQSSRDRDSNIAKDQ